MTAVTDATTVIETLIGRTLTGQQLTNIGGRFFEVDPYNLGSYVDPENPTAEEQAQLILDTFSEYAKNVVRNAAEQAERTTQESTTIDAAGNTAVADLE